MKKKAIKLSERQILGLALIAATTNLYVKINSAIDRADMKNKFEYFTKEEAEDLSKLLVGSYCRSKPL